MQEGWKVNEHECNFVEEQEPEGRLNLGPCIECGIPALEAIKRADLELSKLRALCREMAEVVCSNTCPSVWVTAEGQKHSELCTKAKEEGIGE